MIEEWRQIPSFPTYEASSLGRIRSPWRIRQQTLNEDGYLRVSIYVGGQSVPFRVNVLVCEAFHGPKPPWAAVAAHQNGRKTDNRPGNLRWATHLDNSDDQYRHGTRIHGERHPRAVFKQFQIDSIRAQYDTEPNIRTIRRLAEAFMVAELTIRKIVNGQSWKASFRKKESRRA